MKRIFQTIFEEGKGNCMQAAMASLFDEELENVPHFTSFGDDWNRKFENYIELKGYKIKNVLCNPIFWHNLDELFSLNLLAKHEGIDGVFYASICSPRFNPEGLATGPSHAVLVDKYCNIIHDPLPAYKGIKYPRQDEGFNGVRQVYIIEKQS